MTRPLEVGLMSLEESFLRDVVEHPGDETPRLIYADWLSERGDPRGEFIHLQCELARLAEDDQRRPALEDRAFELEQRWGREWAGPLCGRATAAWKPSSLTPAMGGFRLSGWRC